MAATSPVGKIAQLDPGKYVDEANNLWTGTKEAPVYGGVYSGPKPTSFVDVYGASPSAPVPPPATATPPPPPTGPAAAPPPVTLPSPTAPGTIRANDREAPTPPPGTTPPPTAPPSAPGGFPIDAASQVAQVYQQALGRMARPDEINSWAASGHDLPTILGLIRSSPEAQAYAASHATTPDGARPTGGALTDPAYAARYVAWAGTQPGVNPSVKNDPNYWIGRFTSGAFGNDQEYALQRMMQAEGPPEGGGVTTQSAGMNYDAALAKVQQAIGRSLSPAEIATAFAKFGGSAKDTFTDAGLAPVIAYFKGQGGPSAPEPRPVDLAPAGPGGPLATGTTGPSSNVNSPYGDQGIMDQFRAAIAKRLQEIGSPVDENSANIAAPLTAARNEASRVSDQERNALAERLYAQQGGGLNTDALTRGIQQSAERNAVGLGGLRAQLITREYDARRSDLNAMLAQATASGDNASARAIQQQLAALDAQLKREGMSVDLAKYMAYLNQNAALSGMNG